MQYTVVVRYAKGAPALAFTPYRSVERAAEIAKDTLQRLGPGGAVTIRFEPDSQQSTTEASRV